AARPRHRRHAQGDAVRQCRGLGAGVPRPAGREPVDRRRPVGRAGGERDLAPALPSAAHRRGADHGLAAAAGAAWPPSPGRDAMTGLAPGLIGVCALLLLLVMGMPIGVALGLVGMAGLAFTL